MSAKKPTILLIAPYGFNDRLANYVEFTTGRLLAKNGWRVLAISRREKDETSEQFVEGIEVTRYASTIAGGLRLVKIIFSARPDVIHIHNLRNNQIAFLAAIAAQCLRTPLFFTEYGLPHDHYLAADRDDPFSAPLAYDNIVSSFSKLMMRSLRNPLHLVANVRNYFFHYPLFAARTVVFVSKHNLPIAERLGIKDARYIPYLLDEARWNIQESHENAPPLIIPEGTTALFVGQLKRRKGWDTYLRAIPSIPPEKIRTFILVTPSPDAREFEELVENLHLRERVRFFSRIPGDLLKSVFAAADIVVVPSLYEGFGLVPVEAFEIGKPVIATRVEAMTDFLEDGKNAYLISPDNPTALAKAMIHLAENPEERKRLVAGGDETLREMKSESRQREWLTLYRDALLHAS